MTDHVEMNRRNWEECAAIHARDTTGDYMLDRFRAGEDALHAIEATELGDISGKRSASAVPYWSGYTVSGAARRDCYRSRFF
jgi:hypothetical protein